MLNDHRAESGLPRMGFLNPWIYSIGNRGFTEYVSHLLAMITQKMLTIKQ
jgi:hypothetical protein